VFGVKEPALRKKLLQERQLTLEKAIDICKSGETTAQHLKNLATATYPNEIHTLKHRNERKPRREQNFYGTRSMIENSAGSKRW